MISSADITPGPADRDTIYNKEPEIGALFPEYEIKHVLICEKAPSSHMYFSEITLYYRYFSRCLFRLGKVWTRGGSLSERELQLDKGRGYESRGFDGVMALIPMNRQTIICILLLAMGQR